MSGLRHRDLGDLVQGGRRTQAALRLHETRSRPGLGNVSARMCRQRVTVGVRGQRRLSAVRRGEEATSTCRSRWLIARVRVPSLQMPADAPAVQQADVEGPSRIRASCRKGLSTLENRFSTLVVCPGRAQDSSDILSAKFDEVAHCLPGAGRRARTDCRGDLGVFADAGAVAHGYGHL